MGRYDREESSIIYRENCLRTIYVHKLWMALQIKAIGMNLTLADANTTQMSTATQSTQSTEV